MLEIIIHLSKDSDNKRDVYRQAQIPISLKTLLRFISLQWRYVSKED